MYRRTNKFSSAFQSSPDRRPGATHPLMLSGTALRVDIILKFTLGMDEVAAAGTVGVLVEGGEEDRLVHRFLLQRLGCHPP